MGRGLFSGILWGSLMAVMSLLVLSQLSGMVGLFEEPTEISSDAPAATSTSELPSDQDATAEPATSSEEPVAVARQVDSAPVSPVPDEPAFVAEPVVSPEPAPAAALSAPKLSSPGSNIDAPAVADASAAADVRIAISGQPVLPTADALPTQTPIAPAAPALQSPVLVETVTQPIDLPDAVDPDAGIETAAVSVPNTTTGPDRPVSPDVEPSPGVAPGGDFASPVVVPTPEAIPEEPETELALVEPEPSIVPNADVLDGDGELESQGQLENLATNVRINQLPSIGNSGGSSGSAFGASQAPAQDEAVADATVPDQSGSGSAIKAFAEEFDNPDSRPLMAILLLPDENAGEASAEPLPFPVSFVVDASRDDAEPRMRALRDGGYEVAALMPLPEGATPQDVETAFQIYLGRVPEAVAVIDSEQAAFQSGRAVASQVVQVLAHSGHGMITYSKGLNSAPQVAEREGVPAALVFRDIDGDGQDVAAIKRFLDQAAFKAGQESGVILVGHNRPDTIRALLEWSLGNRASTVALAPVSAVLTSR